MDEPANLPKPARTSPAFPKGVLTFGNRLLAEPNRTEPILPNLFAAISCGQRNCPGCGVTLAARYAIDAAMRATNGKLAVIDAADQLEERSAVRGDARRSMRLMAHGTVRLDSLAKRFERGADVLWVFYDKECGMGGPDAAKGTRGISYAATASIAELHDLESKIAKAINLQGTRYIHIYAPCPLCVGVAPRHTIRLARLAVESGIFPLFEAENGTITRSSKICHRIPVGECLKLQKRFVQLGDEDIARWQEIANDNIRKYGLLSREGCGR